MAPGCPSRSRGRNGRAALCVLGGFHGDGDSCFPRERSRQYLLERVGSSCQIVIYAKHTKCLLCARSWLEAGDA